MLSRNLIAAAGNAAEEIPEGAWDLSYAYYGLPNEGAWDVSTAMFTGSRSVSANTRFAKDVFFKPDGLKMYTVDDNLFGTVGVNEYSLSTAWDIQTTSFVQSFSVATQEADPTGIFFKPDGTKMYVIGFAGRDVNEYSLSTAWNISTASYVRNFSVNSQETAPQDVFFKPDDGKKMYIIGTVGDDVNEYSLSTGWNISTASYVRTFSVSAQELTPTGFFFKSDGTEMYVIGRTTPRDVSQYSLSTAWNISTASYTTAFPTETQETDPSGLFLKPDGLGMYVIGESGDDVNEYVMGGFDLSAQMSNPQDVFFKSDGTKMYIVDTNADDVNEYSLSTAWDIQTASFVQNLSVNAQEAGPTGVFFKPDGTKMYIVGTVGREVNEYSLSTAWDISTATFVQNFSVSAQGTAPQFIFFKTDGTKMYIVETIGKNVNEYSLTTAWDISTASYDQAFSVSAQVTDPQGLAFKPDGTKMYLVDTFSDDVSEYSLSTAWDVSTASYDQNFALYSNTSSTGIFFKSNGTRMYVVFRSPADMILQYNIGVEG